MQRFRSVIARGDRLFRNRCSSILLPEDSTNPSKGFPVESQSVQSMDEFKNKLETSCICNKVSSNDPPVKSVDELKLSTCCIVNKLSRNDLPINNLVMAMNKLLIPLFGLKRLSLFDIARNISSKAATDLWRPPKKPFLKLNFDGSWEGEKLVDGVKKEINEGFFGFVVRDFTGPSNRVAHSLAKTAKSRCNYWSMRNEAFRYANRFTDPNQEAAYQNFVDLDQKNVQLR